MKKISIILAALATAFAVSCNKEAADIDTPDPSVPAGMKEVTISASIDDTATKTSYDAAGKFSWTKGDQISVLASDGNFYTFTAAGSAASTTFSGAIPEGTTIGTYALYPADANHTYDVNEYYPFGFNIPNYKDLSNTNSADLPLHAESADGTNFPFKHMSGGFKFKVNNFDDIFKTAEVSIVTTDLKISGSFQVRKSGTHSGYVTYAVKTSDANELSYIRKVNVVDNSVEVYFPYSPGNDLWGTTTITVVGYDSENNPSQLLSKSADFSGVNHVKGEIIPVTALELPVYVPPVDWTKVDWNSTAVATVTNDADSGDASIEELRLVADNNYMYAWIKSALITPYPADYIDILLSDGDAEAEGASKVWDQWSHTLGIDNYYQEHKGTIDTEGNITSMKFSHNGIDESIECKTDVSDGKINWYLAFPRNYIETYTSDVSTIHVGFRLWTGWNNYAAIPARGYGQSLLEVTLP